MKEDQLRWICDTCITTYCLDCKALVYKNICPNNHPIIFVPYKSIDASEKKEVDDYCICNLCNETIIYSNNNYEDRECDIDICENCYNNKLK